MDTPFSFTIYDSAAALPKTWDTIAENNIFLSTAYCRVLEHAPPANMQCHFIGLFAYGELSGIALAQYIDLSGIDTFNRGRIPFLHYFSRKLASHVLLVGNNMLTGQNAYLVNDDLQEKEAVSLLEKALLELASAYKKKSAPVNLLVLKDFNERELPDFRAAGYRGYHTFSTQPNMVFDLRSHWHSIDDYLAELNTRYRTQYNRARKKAGDILKKKLSAEEIGQNSETIHRLYCTVAGKAPFNTFFLPEDHFAVFKQELGDNFLFYGYFIKDTLVGFSTLIKNGSETDTYFLGYDEAVQKERMLYLNMLYDMLGYAIKKKFNRIIFGRSAMEIKSAVGATAEPVSGIIKHTNSLLNHFTARIFSRLDPKIEWKERSPFK